MDLEKIKEKIFIIRAKDDLGQYLDDEQDWRSDMDYTPLMYSRLDAIMKQAIIFINNTAPPSIDEEMREWFVALKSVEFILRRRGGADYEAFSKGIDKEIQRISKLYITSEKTFFPDYTKW